MYCTVVTEERSRFVAGGLGYWTEDPITPGMLVEVPLRKRTVTGIVIDCTDAHPTENYDLRPITRVLTQAPVLTAVQMELLRWMCSYYYCTPRQALQVFLPAPPWHLLADATEDIVSLQSEAPCKGTKQKALLTALSVHGPMEKGLLLRTSKASNATLQSLVTAGIVRVESRSAQPAQEKSIDASHLTARLPELPDDRLRIATQLLSERAALLCTNRTFQERCTVLAWLATQQWNGKKSSMLLFPTVAEAADAHALLSETLDEGIELLLVTGNDSPATRRHQYKRASSERPLVVVGTRTALFLPIRSLGIVSLDREHDRSWKHEQAPRYHARHVAEILTKTSGAQLLLSSPTPSLDTLRHAITRADGPPPRITLIEDVESVPSTDVITIDLTDARFGNVYPLTTPLIDLLRDRMTRHEASVLLLNRRGTGSGMLCFQCKRPLQNAAGITLSVITRGTAPWLLDRSTGEMHQTPAVCPSCGSTELRTVGAGTERVEDIIRSLFPTARTTRVDADTLESPSAMVGILQKLEQGEIDILLGTQSVLPSLRSRRVTLVGVLVADVGLSVPDFRAGERIFQMLSNVVASVRGRGTALIQTFRPDAPEIKHAIDASPLTYLREELALREAIGYPPATQLIDLIVRRDEKRAATLRSLAEERSKTLGVLVTSTERHTHGNAEWTIRLRGTKARELLRLLPLAGVSIDVDPVE